MVVVVGVVGAHRVEPGVEVRVRLLAAPRHRGVAVPGLDQHRRQQQVVRTARAGGAGREGGTGRAEHVYEVRRHRGRHQAGHHGRQDAPHVPGLGKLVLDLHVRAHVAGARAHDHREVAPVETRLGHRAPGGCERQARLAPHEAALGLGDADVVVGQLARVDAGDLAAPVHRHGRRVGHERRAAPFAQHRLDRGQVVAHVAQDARPGHHDVPPALTRARVAHLACAHCSGAAVWSPGLRLWSWPEAWRPQTGDSTCDPATRGPSRTRHRSSSPVP